MVDLDKLAHLRKTCAALLQDLSTKWEKQDVEYVREEVGHGVYDDALENLIAIGLSNGIGFNASQTEQVQALASIMEMEDSPFLAQLRGASARSS